MLPVKKLILASAALLVTCAAAADQPNPRGTSCNQLYQLQAIGGLKGALQSAVGTSGNGGFSLNMWATLVANDGTVCAVVFSGQNYRSQWLASRVISAQKANTANGLSLDGFAISTANLHAAVQPGGSLFGLQFSNPVDPEVAYNMINGQPDDPSTFGMPNDPMIGRVVGGVNVFGGGLALYSNGTKVGAIGVSGDTSCTDHYVAWEVRHALKLDGFNGTVAGPNKIVTNDALRPDNIIYDFPSASTPPTVQGNVGVSPSGWGHPQCSAAGAVIQNLPSSLPNQNTRP